jgi:outer membrane protein TolC
MNTDFQTTASAGGFSLCAKKTLKLSISTGFMMFLAACAVKPEPLDATTVSSFVTNKTARLTEGQEKIGRSIDMHEAMARAIKYNLDAKIAAFEELLRIEESKLTSMDMLPRLVANGASTSRDSISSSSSRSVLTGRQSLEPSTGQDRDSVTGDLTFSYNILDFGLSYLRATQAADKTLIAEENRRKVANRIVEDVRTAYWRAIASEKLANRIPAMEGRIRQVQRANAALRASGQTSPVAALTFEREVIDLQREVRRMETELASARTQLASLMNLEPGTPFALVDPTRGRRHLALPGSGPDMVHAALHNRAEIRDLILQKRINGTEAKAALLELLPGIQAFVGGNLDQNSFLTKGHWVGWGARASWNLISLIKYPQKAEVIATQDRLIDQKALAATMAVMTQVYISRVKFHHTGKELTVANSYSGVQGQLLHQVRSEALAGKVSDQTVLREEMNQLIATVRADLAYANWQNAYANVYAAIGVDPYASLVAPEASVKDLAGQIKSSWFEKGNMRAGLKLVNLKLAQR